MVSLLLRKIMNNYALLTSWRPVMPFTKLDLSYSKQSHHTYHCFYHSFCNEGGTTISIQQVCLNCDIYNKILWFILYLFHNNTQHFMWITGCQVLNFSVIQHLSQFNLSLPLQPLPHTSNKSYDSKYTYFCFSNTHIHRKKVPAQGQISQASKFASGSPNDHHLRQAEWMPFP